MRFKQVLLPLSLSVIFVAGCTKKGQQLEYGLKVQDTLRINLLQEPPTLDWDKATDTTSSEVIENLMEGLVDYDIHSPDLAPIPDLATSWKSNKTATEWTFTLRKDVKWTDGVPLTAQQFVDGWERLLNPKTGSEYAYYLFPLKNAQAYNSGKIKDFSQVGVHVNDKGELVVDLEHPMSYFPELLGHTATFPIRKDIIAKYGEHWTDPKNIQTLSAYRLKIWDHDKAIVLERNDSYYGEKAKIKDIIGYMINEYSTAINLFQTGRLDFQETIPAQDIPALKKVPGFQQVPMLATYYYGMNVRKPPFNDVRVRQAFSHAVDRKEITDLLAAGDVPLTSWIPTGMFGYESDRGLKFDPVLARKLLDEAGYKDRSKFPTITLAYNSNENHQRIAENVQAQLKKNLGINVELDNQEWKMYLSELQTDPPNIYRMGWVADYPDPDNFMNLMTSYSKNNYSGWANKKYDKLIEQAASSLDKDKRRQLYSQAQQILTEQDVPVIPIYSAAEQILVAQRVHGLPVSPLVRWIFKGVTLK